VDDIFAIAGSAMFPYDGDEASMRLTAVWIDRTGAEGDLSRAKGSRRRMRSGGDERRPASLRQPTAR
jgi:hypothetical protein